ncbi:MAG: pilus assembly protein TadG-related protein [Devosiaceae bacterium]|nr:pilus assembly protein TadG-related protein [Devosiaceae bacterium]
MQLFSISKISSSFLKFLTKEDKGVVAVIFAIILLPILALSGAMVDYSAVSSARSEMQVAVDVAALAAVRANLEDDDELQEIAEQVFSDNIVRSAFADGTVLSVTRIENGVRVDVSTSISTNFLSLLGVSSIDVAVYSEVVDSLLSIEVVMVLDNTFSMNGEKMDGLKDAADLLVTELFSGADNDNIRVGLVPFTQVVNIGTSNRDELGIDIPDDFSIPQADYCRWTYPNSTRSCERERVSYDCVVDGVETTCQRWRYFNCTGDRGERVWACTTRSDYRFRWYGSMGSRDYPLNVTDESYDTDPVPGLLTRWNLYWATRPLTRLTSDEDIIRTAISRMRTSQNNHSYTYIPVGLIWGWRLLSSAEPFTDAAPYDDANKKVMVILTDGANTRSTGIGGYQWMLNQGAVSSNVDAWHYGNDVDDANDKTEELCENIKSEDIIVYTIAFDVDDSDIEEILQNCAGNGGSYYDASNSAELEEAFEDISDSLRKLRVSK